MALITNFDNIISLAPGLIVSKAFRNCLQSRLVEVNQHGHIVHLPLDEVAVEATSVGERELQLLGNLARDMRFDVRDDGLVIAPTGQRRNRSGVGIRIFGACVTNNATNVGSIRVRAVATPAGAYA